MIDVVEQVIERHPKVKNEGIPEGSGRTQVRFIMVLTFSKQDDRSPCTWEHDMEFSDSIPKYKQPYLFKFSSFS